MYIIQLEKFMIRIRQKYNESKIALSWSSLEDLPARVWEAFGMGLASCRE